METPSLPALLSLMSLSSSLVARDSPSPGTSLSLLCPKVRSKGEDWGKTLQLLPQPLSVTPASLMGTVRSMVTALCRILKLCLWDLR